MMAVGDPVFVRGPDPGPRQTATCSRCGALLLDIPAHLTRHVDWHRLPAEIIDLKSSEGM